MVSENKHNIHSTQDKATRKRGHTLLNNVVRQHEGLNQKTCKQGGGDGKGSMGGGEGESVIMVSVFAIIVVFSRLRFRDRSTYMYCIKIKSVLTRVSVFAFAFLRFMINSRVFSRSSFRV